MSRGSNCCKSTGIHNNAYCKQICNNRAKINFDKTNFQNNFIKSPMESTFWEPIRNCLVVDSLASHWIFVDFHASCHFYYAICLLFDFQNVQTVSKQFFDKNWEFWLARWKHRDLDKLFRRDYIINDCCIHHLVGLDPLSTANLGRRHLRLPIPVRSLLILRILGKFWTYIYKHGFIHP